MPKLDNSPIIILSDNEEDDDGEISFIRAESSSGPLSSKRVQSIYVHSDTDSEGELPTLDHIFDTSSARARHSTSRTVPPELSEPAQGQRPDARNGPSIAVLKADTVTDVDPTPGPTRLSAEARRALKEKEQEEKRRAKAAAKASKEAEKSLQKKIAEVNKLRVSKNDSVREIRLYLSADMETPFSPIAGALPEIRARFHDNLSEIQFSSETESPIKGALRIKRFVKARWDHSNKRFLPLEEPYWEWEATTILVYEAEEIVEKVVDGQHALTQWIQDVRTAFDLKQEDQIILIIKGLNKYQAKTKTIANREFAARARAGLALDTPGEQQIQVDRRVEKSHIETAIVTLQVTEKVSVLNVEKTQEMEDWIWNLSADIALRPYKLLSKSHLNFAVGEPKRKASSTTDALEAMLQEVQGITASAAAGIAAVYPTFANLMHAFEKAERRGGETSAETLLSECEIRNLKDGTASGRKLNKALAKRVYQVFRGGDSLALA